eukprot:10617598-Alexandrium_andersonii.AAC.1
MMRSRGLPGPHYRASTFQYHPPLLLYSRGGAWLDLHSSNLATAVATRIPPGLRQGCWHIVRHRARGQHERAAEDTADWIELHGREH